MYYSFKIGFTCLTHVTHFLVDIYLNELYDIEVIVLLGVEGLYISNKRAQPRLVYMTILCSVHTPAEYSSKQPKTWRN